MSIILSLLALMTSRLPSSLGSEFSATPAMMMMGSFVPVGTAETSDEVRNMVQQAMESSMIKYGMNMRGGGGGDKEERRGKGGENRNQKKQSKMFNHNNGGGGGVRDDMMHTNKENGLTMSPIYYRPHASPSTGQVQKLQDFARPQQKKFRNMYDMQNHGNSEQGRQPMQVNQQMYGEEKMPNYNMYEDTMMSPGYSMSTRKTFATNRPGVMMTSYAAVPTPPMEGARMLPAYRPQAAESMASNRFERETVLSIARNELESVETRPRKSRRRVKKKVATKPKNIREVLDRLDTEEETEKKGRKSQQIWTGVPMQTPVFPKTALNSIRRLRRLKAGGGGEGAAEDGFEKDGKKESALFEFEVISSSPPSADVKPNSASSAPPIPLNHHVTRQTIEVDGPLEYDFNYVLKLINDGFFDSSEDDNQQSTETSSVVNLSEMEPSMRPLPPPTTTEMTTTDSWSST
jgi:hypothetical protein